jgi:hypothetical protein
MEKLSFISISPESSEFTVAEQIYSSLSDEDFQTI